MENEIQTINCSGAEILQTSPDSVSNTAVKLVPNDYCDASDNMNANITAAVENLNELNSTDMSIEGTQPPSGFTGEEEDSILFDEHPAPCETAGNSIMDVCGTTAQHIRQTITDVLNSRKEEVATSPTCCDSSVSFEASLKEKLASFEHTCMMTNLPKPVSPHLSATETSVKMLEDLSISETDAPESVIISKSNILVNKTGEEESNELDGSCSGNTNINHPSCGESSDSQSSDISVTNKTPAPLESIEKNYKKSQKTTSSKKKGEKTVDHILKSLSNYPTAEEKLQALCRKHSETLDDFKSAEIRLKLNERQVIQLAREKEQLQAEHNRMVLAKSRLESLCRELQRQNKAVKEESLLRIREEEEKRKDVASKFQTTLNEITTLMQEHSKKNLQLKDENSELAKKLKSLVEHYEMWEKHMEKVLHQKDLESQLAKAKQAKTNLQLKQDTEKFLREKQTLLENLSDLQAKCTLLASNELQLRGELADYTSKYEEFQTVLNKSNQVFATFKADMDSTSKKIKKLEKETNIWKQKWENSNKSLLDMITDKQNRDKELVTAQQRVLTLEKLCRALQAERNDLQSQINGTTQVDEATP